MPACHVEGALPLALACFGDSGGESSAPAAEGAIYLLPGLKASCLIAFLRPLEAPNSGAPIDQSAATRAASCGFWAFPRDCFTFDEGLEGGGAMGCRGDAANAANAVNAAKRPMQQMLENSLF